MIFRKAFMALVTFLVGCSATGGPGYFDSHDGTYTEQTLWAAERMLFHEILRKTVFGNLMSSGRMEEMVAGGPDQGIDSSAAIWRKKITKGDMVRMTLEEGAKGIPTYGDLDPARGDYLPYQNQEYRVNEINSPIIPIQGRMSRQRAGFTLFDIPASVKQSIVAYMAEQVEIEGIISLLYGASPSVLKGTADGGLGCKLGIGGTAGVPLLPRHYYDPQEGYASYSTTQATWNNTVEDAVAAITAGANGYVTLAQLVKLRAKMDALHFAPIVVKGEKFKCVWLCDSELWYRIDNLLTAKHKDARERAKSNPIWNADYELDYYGMRFINMPWLDKFRAGADATNGIPDFGPAKGTNVLQSDPRTFTVTNANALMIGIGAGAMLEGFNNRVTVETEKGRFGKGLESIGKMDLGFKRGEWFAQDGRTGADAAISYGVFLTAFYEPGVGTGYA